MTDDQEVERIMNMTEAELAAELVKDGETIESAAAKGRAIFQRACAIVDARSVSPAPTVFVTADWTNLRRGSTALEPTPVFTRAYPAIT